MDPSRNWGVGQATWALQPLSGLGWKGPLAHFVPNPLNANPNTLTLILKC